MALISLDIPPGLYANGTDLQAQGRWLTGNLIRWSNGIMEPVGGWQRSTQTALDGFPRAMFAWRYGFRAGRGVFGTNEKLYSYDGSDVSDITPSALSAGPADTVAGEGFGMGTFGSGDYGTGQSSGAVVFDAATWSFDNFGDELVAVRRDDTRVWKWDSDTDTEAQEITQAPSALGLLVSNERHLIAFGADSDPRKIAWSDREDYTAWTAGAANSAGDLLLNTNGRYIGAVKSRYGILVLTNIDAHLMRYVRKPFIYGIERESENCGAFGPHAMVNTPKGVVWMGSQGFYLFDGYVTEIPCEVFDRVFNDINIDQAIKISAGSNSEFDEVWWFYPSASSNENDRYVIWNYRENHWSFGDLARGAWLDQGVFDEPLALGVDGHLYVHETGWTDSGNARLDDVYVESAPLSIGEGGQVAKVRHLINDEGGDGYTVTAYTRFTPDGTEYTNGPYTMRAEGYTDSRFTGRQARLRFEGAVDARWRVGKLRAELSPGGKR